MKSLTHILSDKLRGNSYFPHITEGKIKFFKRNLTLSSKSTYAFIFWSSQSHFRESTMKIHHCKYETAHAHDCTLQHVRVCMLAQLLSCVWLFVSSPTKCSPPGSSISGIFQVRILEWVAISSSRGSFQARDRTHVSRTDRQILYHWATWEVLYITIYLIIIKD